MNVLLHCDYKNTKNDFLGVFHIEDQCEINIVMKTPNACLPIPDNVKNAKLFAKAQNSKPLNLSPLKTSNHFVDNFVKDGKFIIGFPIFYGHDAMCEAGTSVCFVNNTESNPIRKYRNMGMMTSDIKFEAENNPVIMLTSNEVCKDGKKFSSKIIFKCDRLVNEGTPTFIRTDDCVNIFEWETEYACVEEKICQISDSNGQIYDFSSFVGLQYKIPHSNKTDEFMHFALCSPATECGNPAWGSCIVKTTKDGNRQTTSIGNFKTKLQIEKKSPFLKYENGGKCNSKGEQFSTRIEFILADNEEDEHVVLIEDKCEIVLHFKTLLVNQNVKNCIVKDQNDVEIDLRPLIDFNENYEATKATNESSDVHYYLNICRPLNSKYSLNCHGNTAACRTVIKDDKHERELSLGHFEYAMSAEKNKDGNTNVIMKYFHGSQCLENNEDHITTKITFFCDELAGMGNPILKSTNDCIYDFEFPTNILCADKHISLKNGDSCKLINDKSNKRINLESYGIFEADNLKIDICDGNTKYYTLKYKDSMLVIEYAQHDKGKCYMIISLVYDF